MKGLSMTLTIVIIAIVLLVTALVIMTIFGAQIAQVMGILNPWSSAQLETSLCRQACSNYCQLNPGQSGTQWAQLSVETQNGKQQCNTIMQKSVGTLPDGTPASIGSCQCMGLSACNNNGVCEAGETRALCPNDNCV